MSTEQQLPKLSTFSIVFICILIISTIVVPIAIVNSNQTNIKQIINQVFPKTQTYNFSNFSVFGHVQVHKEHKRNPFIRIIKPEGGFCFTSISDNKTTAKLRIKYLSSNKSDGTLKVNDEEQYLTFSSTTNQKWTTKEVIVKMEKGENNIEFSCGSGSQTKHLLIAEIKIIPDNNILKDDTAGHNKSTDN